MTAEQIVRAVQNGGLFQQIYEGNEKYVFLYFELDGERVFPEPGAMYDVESNPNIKAIRKGPITQNVTTYKWIP